MNTYVCECEKFCGKVIENDAEWENLRLSIECQKYPRGDTWIVFKDHTPKGAKVLKSSENLNLILYEKWNKK